MRRYQFKGPTDKQPGGWHQAYIPVYERLFDPIKDMESNILEIGVDGGYSVIAHADYFKNASHVIGIDISPMPESLRDVDRVGHSQRDAYTIAPFGFLFGECSVIIDDGPHTLESQQFFVANYTKLLTPDGISVVEDVQSSEHFAELGKHVPEGFESMAIDLRHVNGRYDDLLFVIWRK